MFDCPHGIGQAPPRAQRLSSRKPADPRHPHHSRRPESKLVALGLDSTREGKKILKPLSHLPKRRKFRDPRRVYEQDTPECPGDSEDRSSGPPRAAQTFLLLSSQIGGMTHPAPSFDCCSSGFLVRLIHCATSSYRI